MHDTSFENLELFFKTYLANRNNIKVIDVGSNVSSAKINEWKKIIGEADYITIPQRFAVDNLQRNLRNIKKQIQKTESEIFLVGIGHAKSGILHKLKEYKSATYVDIGVGIDALAGVVNLSRSYFGSWTNHQFKNRNIYSEIDFLVNNNDHTKDNLILI